MPDLTDKQINYVAEKVFNIITNNKTQKPTQRNINPISDISDQGIFNTIDEAVNAATIAHKHLINMPLSSREKIITSIRKTMLDNVQLLSEQAVAETGLGRVEDKIAKNKLVSEKTPGTEDLFPTARSGDRGLSLFEPAPYGVIGAITPVTNPTSTIIRLTDETIS